MKVFLPNTCYALFITVITQITYSYSVVKITHVQPFLMECRCIHIIGVHAIVKHNYDCVKWMFKNYIICVLLQ